MSIEAIQVDKRTFGQDRKDGNQMGSAAIGIVIAPKPERFHGLRTEVPSLDNAMAQAIAP